MIISGTHLTKPVKLLSDFFKELMLISFPIKKLQLPFFKKLLSNLVIIKRCEEMPST